MIKIIGSFLWFQMYNQIRKLNKMQSQNTLPHNMFKIKESKKQNFDNFYVTNSTEHKINKYGTCQSI